jgi:hypothetical protein
LGTRANTAIVPVFLLGLLLVDFAKKFFTYISVKPVETALIKQSENEHNMSGNLKTTKKW